MYRLSSTQFLPIDRHQAWEFFSSPKNLALITPRRLNFKILSISGGDQMHEGQIIKYKVSVLPFIRMYWETEITEVKELQSFTDIQRKGPYSYWAHKHSFADVEGGVEMTDELQYSIPLGIAGRMANSLFVAREVRSIFDYRFHVLKDLFSKTS